MNDSSFMATLAEIVGTTDQWVEYGCPPEARGPVTGGKIGHEAQLAYMRSRFRERNSKANSPQRTPLDSVIENLSMLFQDATPAQRAMVRPALPPNAGFALHCFAQRMAVRALRERSREPLTLALTAVCIEDTKLDFRDTITSLALLNHVAERIQIDPEQLFRDAIAMSTERTSKMIVSFLARSPEMKSLSAVGFHEGSSEYGRTLEDCRVSDT